MISMVTSYTILNQQVPTKVWDIAVKTNRSKARIQFNMYLLLYKY